MGISSTTDNRIFERIEGELGIRYSPQGSNREFCTTTKDISGGGIKMLLLKTLAPGTILDLEIFKYSTNLKVRCRCKIVWVDNGYPLAGLQFIDTPLLHIGRLIEYLQEEKL